MNKNTKIIAAYSGLGKTWCTEFFNRNTNKIVIDADSSHFSWKYDLNGDKLFEKSDLFPESYINYIRSFIGKADYIFTSTDKDIVTYFSYYLSTDSFKDKFYVAVPEVSDRMLKRLTNMFYDRESYDGFIKDQIENFYKIVGWIFQNIPTDNLIIIGSDEHLSDALYKKWNEEFTLMNID